MPVAMPPKKDSGIGGIMSTVLGTVGSMFGGPAGGAAGAMLGEKAGQVGAKQIGSVNQAESKVQTQMPLEQQSQQFSGQSQMDQSDAMARAQAKRMAELERAKQQQFMG